MAREVSYPVIFNIDSDDGFYLVEIPDLEIITQGVNQCEVFSMAYDAIGLICLDKLESGIDLPIPSNSETLKINGRQMIQVITVDLDVYQESLKYQMSGEAFQIAQIIETLSDEDKKIVENIAKRLAKDNKAEYAKLSNQEKFDKRKVLFDTDEY
jgi:predicted RNase H-like HicB family nuclease